VLTSRSSLVATQKEVVTQVAVAKYSLGPCGNPDGILPLSQAPAPPPGLSDTPTQPKAAPNSPAARQNPEPKHDMDSGYAPWAVVSVDSVHADAPSVGALEVSKSP
jgi:hypothetical protein